VTETPLLPKESVMIGRSLLPEVLQTSLDKQNNAGVANKYHEDINSYLTALRYPFFLSFLLLVDFIKFRGFPAEIDFSPINYFVCDYFAKG
jgi:hypothetical protein